MASILKVDTIQPQTTNGSLTIPAKIEPITYLTAASLTLTAAHESITINFATSVAITVPLGSASNIGKSYRLKNCGAGIVTLTGTSAQTFFDYQSQVTMTLNKGDTIEIQWDGNYWVVWY